MQNFDLINPFPTDKLKLLQFGFADGRKDKYLTDATFVKTFSISQFVQDNHSVIIGPMGSGKSALFKLLKEKSKLLKEYNDYIVVPIQENISFFELKTFLKTISPDKEERYLYQFMWKFQITLKLAETLYNLNLSEFPRTGAENEVNDFLKLSNSTYEKTIIDRVKDILSTKKASISASLGDSPFELSYQHEKHHEAKEINLDRILKQCQLVLKDRKLNSFLIIIDRLDAFVAGEEYHTQRKFIEALLEVEDDMEIRYDRIKLKIFIRSDLFSRLNFEILGRDKVSDNVLEIKWSSSELMLFIAKRLLAALKRQNILTLYQVLREIEFQSDISIFDLTLKDRLIFKYINSKWLKNKIIDKYVSKNKYAEQDTSTNEKIAKAIITKVFPRSLNHKNSDCKDEEIDIFTFLETHFLNGHGEASPRNILYFLKQVNNLAIDYYEHNPDHIVYLKEYNHSFEWPLYLKNFIHKAYVLASMDFIKNISKTDDKWTRYFSVFLNSRGKKTTFDYLWMKQKLKDVSEEDTEAFFSYLEHIGFLKITHHNIDCKKRKYVLPIIYMKSC